jgi:hypothetical protein
MWSEESSTEQETTGGSVGSSGVNFKVGVHKGQGSLLSSTRTAATLRGKLAVDEDEEDVGKVVENASTALCYRLLTCEHVMHFTMGAVFDRKLHRKSF